MARILTFALALSTMLAQAQRQDPNQLLRAASDAQQSGDLPAAIGDYRAFLQIHPNFAEARVNLGAALALHGDYDQAVEEFEIALPLTRTKLKSGVYVDIGLAYYKKGDLAKAREPLQTALDLQPTNAQAASLLADCYLKQNNPDSAVKLLLQRAALAEQNMDFAYVLGVALIRTGSLRAGAQSLDVVANNQSAPGVFLLAGSAWLEIGAYEEARRDLELAHKMNPGQPGLAALLGIVRDRTGDSFAAQSAFREALQLAPGDANLDVDLAAVLAKRHELAEAPIRVDKALILDPSTALGFYEDGLFKSYSNQPERSAADLRKAIALNPAWLDPHLLLVSVLDRLHRTSDAEAERKIIDKLTNAQ